MSGLVRANNAGQSGIASNIETIDSDDYVDASIDTAHIGNDQVTGAKLNPSLVLGDIIYADGTDTIAKLAKGSEDEVLTMGGSNAPTWAAAGGGKVLQVIQAVKTAGTGITNTAWTAVPALTLDITPALGTKVLVLMSDSSLYRDNTNLFHVTIQRDTTNLGNSTAGFMYGYGQTSGAVVSISYLDTHGADGSTAVTYAVYCKAATSGTLTFVNGAGHATITAIEIG